jgi:hypothetical protein
MPCGGACVTGTDCSHAVVVDPVTARNVYVNGGTFLKLVCATTNDIRSVTLGGAAVAFQPGEPGRLWIEIPPGVPGPADVSVQSNASTTVSKRAVVYRAVDEGTTWTKKTMSAARGGFPAMTTTFDDRAFVGAGYTVPQVSACTDTADLFVRDTQTSTPAANAMSTKRWTATATTLLGGLTVVAGACYSLGACPYDPTLIDHFDPTTDKFTPAAAKLSIPRGFLRDLRLADGRILFASDETPHFEIYDPVVDQVSPVPGGVFSTLTPVTGWTARLRDGRVLVVPGGGDANSIFDPTAATFMPAGGSLTQYPDALVALGNGHVLAIGGITVGMMNGVATQTTVDTIAELDPQSGKFTPWAAKLAQSRVGSTAVLARDGRVYVIGGMSGTGKLYIACANDMDIAPFTFLSSVEILDPAKATVTAGPPLPEANLSLRSTILFDGSIIAGGGTPCGSQAMSYPSVYFLEAPPDPPQ